MTLPWALPSPTISSCYKYDLSVTTPCSSRVLRPSLSLHCFFGFKRTLHGLYPSGFSQYFLLG